MTVNGKRIDPLPLMIDADELEEDETPSIKTVTMTFDSMGGLPAYSSIEVSAGSLVSYPEPPKKDNYIFGGWYKEPECISTCGGEAYIFADKTFYADWIATNYEVLFYSNKQKERCPDDFYNDGVFSKIMYPDGYYIAASYYGCTKSEISIPAVFNGLPVAAVFGKGFEREGLVRLTIPSSVIFVTDFYGCENLTVYFESAVPPIQKGSFDVKAIYVAYSALNDYLNNWPEYSEKIFGY